MKGSAECFELGSGTSYGDTTAFWRKIFADMTLQEIIKHEKIGPIFLREIGYEDPAEKPSKIPRLEVITNSKSLKAGKPTSTKSAIKPNAPVDEEETQAVNFLREEISKN